MNVEPAKLPDGLEAFAKAAAILAEENGIDAFEMTVKPKFELGNYFLRSLYGEIKVRFWQTDGRGRPSRNIVVNYQSSIELPVEYTPASSN